MTPVALYRAAVAGPETKTLLVYDEPFWRADGFSGQTAEPQSVAEVTIDASPAAGVRGAGVDQGCSMARFPPGALTRYGPLLREPLGRLHWAGTETSTVSHGAMDGAARSGERAAAEILAIR